MGKEKLPEGLGDLIAETARRTVIEYEQRQQTRTADAMLHNTTILMENYKILKDYAAAEAPGAPARPGNAYLESITSSKIRTSFMVAALDQALAEVQEDCSTACQSYKWEAFAAHYIAGKSYEDIAAEQNSGKNSPARWCKEIMRRLAVRLFGVDGLKRW